MGGQEWSREGKQREERQEKGYNTEVAVGPTKVNAWCELHINRYSCVPNKIPSER